MPLSSATYTGNGLATQFNVPFLYVNRLDVQVAVNTIPVTYTWIDDQTIQIQPAPDVGASIVLTRTTDVSSLVTDFEDGANLTAKDLDSAYRQALFYAEELKERLDFYVDFWGNQIVGGGDLPPTSEVNQFLICDGTGGWVVRSLGDTQTILGISDLQDVTGLPDNEGKFGFLFSDGTNWKILGQKPTRDVLNLGNMALHDVSEFSTAIITPIGTAVGNLVALQDIGGGVAGLPAVDGSLLTGVSREKHILVWESHPYNEGGGAYNDNTVWATKSLNVKVLDDTGAVTVASGMVTLPAGKYRFRIKSNLMLDGHGFVRLAAQDGTVLGTSNGHYNINTESVPELWFEDTLTDPLTVKVQVRSTGTSAGTEALGNPHNTADLGNNIYTIFEAWQLPG
jgi:hypothetical protein